MNNVQDNKAKILFVNHMSTFFTEQIGIIKLCLNNNIIPIIHFVPDLQYVLPQLKTCLELNIEIYDSEGERVYEIPTYNIDNSPESIKTETVQKRKHIFRKILKFRDKVKTFLESPVIDSKPLHQSFKLRAEVMNKLINKMSPSAIILGGDLVGHDTAIIIKEAKKHNIKTIVLTPILANGDDPANMLAYLEAFSMENPINRLVGKIFPKWVHKYKDKDVLRLPASQIFLYKRLGIEPPLPWVFNSGHYDLMFVEGQEAYDYYIKAGLGKNKIRIVGNVNHDVLYEKYSRREELREELCNKYNFDKGKKLIISTMHPDYMLGVEDFANHHEFTKYWCNILTNLPDVNILGCIHPGVDEKFYKKFETDNFKIFDGCTIDIAGLGDIFVTVYSSALKWAIMTGIPVVNYDLAKVNYNFYDNTPGVLTINNKRDFENILTRLISDEAYYSDVVNLQKEKSDSWGLLDGRASERILAILNSIIKENNNGK